MRFSAKAFAAIAKLRSVLVVRVSNARMRINWLLLVLKHWLAGAPCESLKVSGNNGTNGDMRINGYISKAPIIAANIIRARSEPVLVCLTVYHTRPRSLTADITREPSTLLIHGNQPVNSAIFRADLQCSTRKRYMFVKKR